MPEEWERIRPSWKKIHKFKEEPKPQVTLTRSPNRENRKNYDRIGFNQSAISRMGIVKSTPCNLLIQKHSRQIAVKVLEKEKPDADSFLLSLNKKSGSIRRKNLFYLLDLPIDISESLRKIPFRTELRAEGGLYIFKLPDKETGKPSENQIEIPDNDLENILSDGL